MLAAWGGFRNGPGEQQLFGGAGSPGLLPAWRDSPATQGCGEASIAQAGRGQSFTHTHRHTHSDSFPPSSIPARVSLPDCCAMALLALLSTLTADTVASPPPSQK